MHSNKIPIGTINRLSFYYRGLSEFRLSDFIRSEELAKLTGFGAAQIRRDLTYFGQFGTPGKGYPVKELKEKILKILGVDRKWKVALIGIGNLGSALLSYKGFKEQGFEIVAAFDNDRRKIGSIKAGLKIQDINLLPQATKKEQIKMAIITVPVTSAQEIVSKVVDSNIKAILNFAPAKVKVPDAVTLLNIDMSIELEKLSYLTTKKELKKFSIDHCHT